MQQMNNPSLLSLLLPEKNQTHAQSICLNSYLASAIYLDAAWAKRPERVIWCTSA
jgi:hypothetical protein